ncbi:Smyd1 [Columba guinea]|nr:Smyd1 [Columba guinea]
MTRGGMESVEVFTTEGKGRGLKAQKEFLPGDVIFAEPAYAAVVFDSLTHVICHTCFKRQERLHRCGQCKFAYYCDRTCQRAAWLNHKNECSAIKRHGKAPTENIRLAARIMWKIEREGSGLSEGCLVSIDDLQNHVDSFDEEEKKELRADISCNGFTLSDQRGLQAVGVGIFPNLCQANHDCWPNCTVIFNNGNHEAVRSMFHTQMRGEKWREELRNLFSYGCKMYRVATLMSNTLAEVSNTSQLGSGTISAQSQAGLRAHCDIQPVVGRLQPSAETVKEVIQFSKDTLEKISKARMEGLYHEVVKLCRECLKKQEPVLGDTNIYLLRILSIASEVLSYLQMFEEAADYAKRMVDGYLKIYHPNNAQLGMAVMRAGVTHWHAGLIEAGHGLICKAYAILLITHGPSHPITKDLEVMRVQTEMELRMFQQNEFMYYKMREAALKNQKIQVMPEPSNETSPGLFHKKE